MAYEVQTEVFEGPFDLLLHLILSQQVELYEISLSRIVDAAKAATKLGMGCAAGHGLNYENVRPIARIASWCERPSSNSGSMPCLFCPPARPGTSRST